MLVDLSQLSTQSLKLQLSPPETPSSERQFVHILETSRLSGVLESGEAGVRLSNTISEWTVLEALRLVFGSVILEAEGATQLVKSSTDYSSASDGVDLSLLIGELKCPKISVVVGTVVATAHLEFSGGSIRVNSDGGKIFVPQCTFRSFSVDIAGIKLSSPELRVQNLVISWGESGFELHADELVGTTFGFLADAVTVHLERLECTRLDIIEADWSMKGFFARSAQVLFEGGAEGKPGSDGLKKESTEDGTAEGRQFQSGSSPIVALELLDRLSGHINVDLGLEVQVPIVQHRRAVHQFRVPIEAGKLNYRELESNLALLEDTLLDFSVRPGELVLELGIPFLPTRGHGRKLVRWSLSQEEETMAKEHWVRLSTLAQPELVAGGEASEELAVQEEEEHKAGNDPIRQLTFRNVDLELSLERPESTYDAMVKTMEVGKLGVQGDLVYRTTGVLETTKIAGSLSNMGFSLDDFPLAGKKFDLNRVMLEGDSRFEAEFETTNLKRGIFELGTIRARSIDFGTFAAGAVD